MESNLKAEVVEVEILLNKFLDSVAAGAPETPPIRAAEANNPVGLESESVVLVVGAGGLVIAAKGFTIFLGEISTRSLLVVATVVSDLEEEVNENPEEEFEESNFVVAAVVDEDVFVFSSPLAEATLVEIILT